MQITSQTTFDYRKYWNVVKGIAIVSMVLGHAIQFGSGSDYYNSLAYFDNIVFRCIYGCHMPLLIFVSGYLFAFSIRKYSLKTLCHKKIMSLLVPLIVNVSILMLLYESNYSSLGGLKYTCMHIVYSLPKKLWFLWAVLYCMIFVVAINRLRLNKYFEYTVTFLCVIAFYFIPDEIIPNAELYKYMLPYFIIGYYFNGKETISNFRLSNVLLFSVLSIIIYAMGILYFHKQDYVYISGSYILKNQEVLANIIICLKRIGIGLVGIVTVLAISYIIVVYLRKISNAFAFCGEKSLGIYLFSTWCFDGLALHLYASYNITYILLTFIAVLSFSLCLTILVEKNSLSRLLLLGGR